MHTSILSAIIGGFIVLLLGELFIGNVLTMLNVPDDVYPYALMYIRIYLLGMPVIFLYNFEAAIFRSVGDTKIPLIALALSGVLNIILNIIFVVVFKMNVNGVAIATVISNTVSSIVLLIQLIKSDKCIRFELKELRIDKDSLKHIIKIGLPAGIQSMVFNLANVVIQSAINSLGTVVIAASSAAYNIEIFVYYIFNSFSQACTTFVGQNYGAGQIKRCRKILFLCLIEDLIACVSAIIIILFSGHFLLSLFNNDPEVIALGYTRLVMIFTAYLFSMTYDVMSGYLRGFGISLVPAILTIIGVCGTRIAWVYMVFPKSRNFHTLMSAYPVSLSITAVLILIALLAYHPAKKYADN